LLVPAALAVVLAVAPASYARGISGQIVTTNQNQYTPGDATYAAPLNVLSLPQGSTLTYTNLALAIHDIVAAKVVGGHPVFRSNGAPNIGHSTSVDGVEKLAPGNYVFHCSLHPSMTGTLQITAALP
jgi:plastocyanin